SAGDSELATVRSMMELAILIGLQASGKSTFARRTLAPTHLIVSKDTFPNARHPQRRQVRIIDEALGAGRDIVVDNTNPGPQEWYPLIELARTHDAATVGYWFPPDVPAAVERNAAREGRSRVPDVGLYATLKRLQRPRRADGFDRLYVVRFDGAGGFDVRPAPEET
ncbi:MAG TPA: ATP-binding protein, partial [Rugosimonospora sp.]